MKKITLLLTCMLPIVMFAQRSVTNVSDGPCSTTLYCDFTLLPTDEFLGFVTDYSGCLEFLGRPNNGSRGAFRIAKGGNHTTMVGVRFLDKRSLEHILYPEDDYSYNFNFAPAVLYRIVEGRLRGYPQDGMYFIEVYTPTPTYLEDNGITVEYHLPSNWQIVEIMPDGACRYVVTGPSTGPMPPSVVCTYLINDECQHITWGVEGQFPPGARSFGIDNQNIDSDSSSAKVTQTSVYDLFGSPVYNTAAGDNFDIKSINLKNGIYVVKTIYDDGSTKDEKITINK